MSSKTQAYAQLADDTARRITGDYLEWAAFLTTSSRLYKYPYHDQLMIYAQRPDATACAAYNLWNDTMRRYIRRGSKGIALLTPGPYGMDIRYVFDVSDTGARQNSRSVNPWVLSEETRQPVRQILEDQYYADAALGLEQQIGQIARQQAQDYWQTHARDIRDSVDGTALLMYDDNSIGASFRTAAAASISYMIQSRCGLKPDLIREDFEEVLSWNTPAAVAELGKAVSEIAGQVLRQIETTVRVTERSMNHERVDLQEERRLPSAGNGPDRNGTPARGQVRAHEAALPEGEQTRTVHQTDSERETDGTASGNRSGSAVPAGNHHEPAGETEQRDRRTESAGSDGLGGRDEQPQEPGGGNDPLGTDLHLSDSPSEFEDVEQINFLIPGETEQIAGLDRPSPLTQPTKAEADPSAFSLSAEEIDNILRAGPNIEHSKIRIALLYGKNPTRQEAQDYLKKEYGIGGHSHTYLDGTPGFVDFNGQGMRFTRDHFTKEMRLRWPAIERRIRDLIQADDYLNGAERQALIELNRIQDINNSPEPREALPQEPIENVRAAEEPEDNSDIDDALREWNGDIASKQAVVRYMTDHADDPDAADWLKREYGDDLPSFPVTSKDVSTDLPWSTVQRRIALLIHEDRFYTETERDALDDIDVEAVREHLERGDSSATDEMLEMAQTTQAEEPSHERFTVMETEDGYAVWDNVREAVYADEGAAPRTFPSEAQAEAYLQQVRQQVEDQVSRDWMYVECARNSVEPPKQEYAYTVGDTVYLDNNPFEIEQIGNFDVHLRDLNAVYPISRAENKQSFEAMLWSDARNAQYLPSNAQTVVPTNNMEITVSSGEAAVMEPQLAQAGIGTAKFVHEDGAVTFSFSASDQEAMEALAERIRTQLRQGPANDHNDDFQAISLERIDPDVREVLTTGLLTEQDKDAISDWFRDGEDNTVVAQRLSEMFAGNSETMQMITGEDADYFTSTSGISVEILDKYEARRSAPWDEVAAMLRTLYQQNLDGFSREQAQQEAAHPFEKGSNERQEPTVSSTTEAVYSSTQTRLPYDVVIERLHFDEPEHDAPVPASATEPVGNFHIQDEHLGEGGAKTKFSRNLEAIRTLKLIERENRTATPEEQGILSRYVGWGAMPQAFDSANREWAKEYADLQSVLNPQEYEAARASTLNAHYTSPTVIKAIYEAVKNMGFKTGNILEPSMGIGNFFGLLPEDMQGSRLYGVELDSITGRIAKQLYPNADITVAGFETTDRRDFFDLAIGNVPFGSYKVSDKRFDKYNFLIHDYFFAKALDQVRPGGLIAFVTSKGTMDKQNPEVRRYIAQRAELCGAIRLPKTAFKANAGTEVTTDILFLQKREQPMVIEPEWIHLSRTDDGIPINSYFEEHPEMVLGRMAWDDSLYGNEKETACLPFDGADLSEQLAQAVKHIIGEYHATEAPDLEESTEIQESIPADPNVKNYSYTVVDGKVYYRENSIMVSPKLNETSQERIAGMVELRNCVHRLMDAQLAEDSDIAIQALQAELNERYDTFTAKYGLINSRANAQAFRSDSSYYLLSSLEILNENGEMVRKADMFTKRTIRPKKSIDHVDTSVEALAVSIAEKAAVDLSFMSKLTGKNADEIVADLKGVIFQLPESSEENESPTYVTADEYLSGNVRQKLEKARAAAERSPVFQPNIEALEKAQPKDLDASEIDVRLGATWVDRDYIQQFMQELFDIPFYQRRSIQVQYSELTSEWRISGKSSLSYNNVANNITYGTNRANGLRILEDTLNLRDIRIYDTIEDVDGKEKRVLNQKETTLAQQKQQAIKDAFRDWIWRDADRREELTRKYNVLFNSIRPREYDGSHITFSGMNPEITLREHQRNAIAHTLYGGNTLLAHVVGAGKTYEMAASAMESKRLGLCSKSMFVVPNHLTEQWASEFLRLYPSANILVTSKKDFEKNNRRRFCSRIATGDYDAIIIGHSQFEKIPMSKERQERLLQEQIEEVTQGIQELKFIHGEQFTIKQMERTRKQLEGRLRKLQAEERKDDVVTFEELGVDRLFVDEAHSYKNLFLTTKMRNVAGLSTSEAQKSTDMYLKCRYMDEITGGRGIIFATGTPISNSMTEMYTMQRYLQNKMLHDMGLNHFDAWASTFGETTTAIELAPEGTGYRARTRFAKFFNLPELMSIFKETADVKTADQLCLPTPTPHYETVVVQPTEIQKAMVQSLSKRAARVHSGSIDSRIDNMLKITSDGRKLGLDQRLINPLLPDDPHSKVNACVNNVFRIWQEGTENRLTQLIFCDISTPKGTEKAGQQETLSSSPEDDEVMSFGSMEDISEISSEAADSNFSVYADIRDKLIARGVPPEEIAFIHDADSESKKKELFAKVRAGQVRVLLGSTAKMGAGTNCQDRLIALHDLDCPWRPGDLEQRSGRIIRQGNMNPDVQIYRYATEGTFDSYLWQTVENKQKFISQIMTSKSPVRSCEDIDETALSYAEIKALCAGDPNIKEKMDLDVDVARLRLMKADHQAQQYRLEDRLLKYFPQEIERNKAYLQGFEQDQATVAAHPLLEESFVGMTVNGKTYAVAKDAGEGILEACKNFKDDNHSIGEYRGFTMSLMYNPMTHMYMLTLRGAMSHTVEIGNDARGNITRIDNALAGIPKRMQDVENRLSDLQQQMASAKAELGKPFPQEEELRSKCSRLAELDAKLNLDHPTAEKNKAVQER